MAVHVIHRVLRAVLVLALIGVLTFVLFTVLPDADPARLRAGLGASPAVLAHISAQLGVHRSLWVQFADYMKGIFLHLNLGYSYRSGRSVLSLIVARLPATLSLAGGAAVLWLVVGLPIAVLAARRRGRLIDRGALGTALALGSTPVFWLGLIALYLFASDIGRFPILPGANSYVPVTVNPGKWFSSLILPWLVLASCQGALYFGLVRDELLGVSDAGYIRTARAKGLTERRVISHHLFRPVLPRVIVRSGSLLGGLLGAIVVTETVFKIRGVGLLDYEAVRQSDFAVVQGTVVLAAIFVVVVNLVLDLAREVRAAGNPEAMAT
jgi:peptide/nickel transport system permease protein